MPRTKEQAATGTPESPEEALSNLLARAWNGETKREMARELTSMGLGPETIRKLLLPAGREK